MPLSADYIVDRHRLKRRLVLWRFVAIVGLVAAIVAIVARTDLAFGRHYVARLFVDGIILEDQERNQALADIASDDRVKALIVHIDSPGGTVVGGESLFHRLRRVAAKKPVVAVMGEIATSAAYMTALGSDRIYAREGTLTGSIGVILQTADLTGLLDKIGVKPETIKSAPLKGQPNPLEPLTPEARAVISKVIHDIFEVFVGIVEKRRGLDHTEALKLADGRVFTGREAKANGLIDSLGGEFEAREWLADARGIKSSLPIRDVELGGPERELRDLFSGIFGKALFPETLKLDGLISLWQPEL